LLVSARTKAVLCSSQAEMRRGNMRRIGRLTLITVGAVAVLIVTGASADTLRFVTVTAGADHSCALTDRGDAYCWGANEFGQLGNGEADSVPHTKPVRVSGGLKFTTLVAGLTYTCGMTRDGAVFCWGANDSAQLGDGTVKNSVTPVRVATDIKFKAIGPGGSHTCAVSLDSVGYCWGGNWHGQLGVGDRDGDTAAPCCSRMPKPIRTELRFRTVIAGGIDSCGVSLDGKAYCWGSPQEGRLGTGAADAANKSADKTVPTAVVGDLLFATVTPRWNTCGLSSTGTAFCWGAAGVHGVLGSGNTIEADFVPVPVRVSMNADLKTITVGPFHNCALTRDGVAYCWGENTDGELGDGTTRDAPVPRQVATSRRFIAIAAGGNALVAKPGDVKTWGFTCGVTTDAGVLCWGDNRHGALGNGSTSRALTPVPISDPTEILR